MSGLDHHAVTVSCPDCGVSLLSKARTEEYVDGVHPPGIGYVRREIGVRLPDLLDGVILYFMCPDCYWAWPRLYSDPDLSATAAQAARAHNDNRLDLMEA